MRTITNCRSCGAEALVEVLSLGELHVSAFVNEGEDTPKYPLELVLCSVCSLVQLRHTVPADEMYRNYWYRSGTNHSMIQELRDIARAATVALGKDRFTALDIGCNDGTLLRAYDVARVHTIGFEPAKNLIKYAEKGVDCVVPNFFNATEFDSIMQNERADIVTSIAMFYDLDEPNEFVKDVYHVMADDGVWVIQMADLKSMLDRNMWDNICHEHLEYYSLIALEKLLARHNFYVQDIQHNDVNGGSIRVFVRKLVTDALQETDAVMKWREAEIADKLDTVLPYTGFASRVKALTEELVSFVRDEVYSGKRVYAYGASTKGNTLLQYAGIGHLISAAAERNPDKWGKLTVGTNIPIISEEAARAEWPDYFLVLPWHFKSEFLEREREYLEKGGAFIFPLPKFEVVRG